MTAPAHPAASSAARGGTSCADAQLRAHAESRLRQPTAEEAEHCLADWDRRGWRPYSDRFTQSTGLLRAPKGDLPCGGH